MYYSLFAVSFFIAVLILVYRNRSFFLSLLPESLLLRLPPSFQPQPSTTLPYSTPTNSTSSSVFSRLFGSLASTSRYTRLPGFDWNSNLENGLNSTLFDITANMDDGDTRTGLDPRGAQDVQTIMQEQGVSFDQARLIRHQQILVQNNIDPNTGMPLDSKAVTSLGGRPGSSRR
ncbi:uncharacterized protein MEPE_05823 [Melanopsichium pennsylvanicum]|uniref:Uncharacterized protein n=2 Tax=Melanopsichium pennsylvanicum TaxID=63383 RepID=A0AAJ4XTS9_9BASI|nr:conserved hypothetical protein [Melanopsichium pennsylvanicum 4]SNX87113.1 uncharacterized protein MEPE_05823 [Melanopsichium pennsylvanicum]